MTTTILPMASSPNSLKRTYQEADLQDLPPSGTLANVAPDIGGDSDQPVSQPPAEIILPLQNDDLLLYPGVHPSSSSNNSALLLADDANPIETTQPKPATNTKRRKFTAEEQEARRLEREAKDRQRAEEKLRLEEVKKVKEAEKEERRKEKEVQARQREEERQKKEAQREEERKKKEEERTKKDKAQLRLNSFFSQPSIAQEGSTSVVERGSSHSPCERGRNDTSSAKNDRTESRSSSNSRVPSKAETSYYEKFFRPFCVHSHTVIAPQSQFSRDRESLEYAQNRIDEGLGSSFGRGGDKSAAVFDPIKLFHLSPHRWSGKHRHRRFSVKEIVDSIQGTAYRPIDLTDAGPKKPLRNPADLLKRFTVKYLKFAEDVRPPYIGTYSKICDQSEGSKLSRKPFAKTLPATNYDYDSEAEWEEPGEGEDLDSEGEEEAGEDEDDDEMEGFLDDEEGSEMVRAANLKHRSLNGDLEPLCTGLCWENASDQEGLSSVEGKVIVDMSLLRLDILSDSFHLPIDPYSTLYWQPTSTLSSSNYLQPTSSMDPPRLPLTMINRTNTLLPIPHGHAIFEDKSQTTSNMGSSTLAPPTFNKPPKRLIAPELMTAFAAAVRGSDLTKAGLIEMLKKQFPKQTKDAIKDTLNLVAERIGSREADKRWVIKEGVGIGF